MKLLNRPSIAFIDYVSYRQLIDHRLIVDIPTQDSTGSFFDSFGNAPDSERFPTSIKTFLISNSPVMLYSIKWVQDFTSDVCGQHCVFFLYHLARGRDYNYVINLYSDNYIKNDKMVSLFVRRLRSIGCNKNVFSCIQCVQTCNSCMMDHK